jgi:chitodextrinase
MRSVTTITLAALAALLGFAVLADPADAQATGLKFIVQPGDVGVAMPFSPIVQVALVDASGNIVPSSATVSLSLRQGWPAPATSVAATGASLVNAPGQAAVGALPSVTSATGRFAFPGLAVSAPSPTSGCSFTGTPCTFILRATSGAMSIDSKPFTVTRAGAPWGQVQGVGTHAAEAAGTADFSTRTVTLASPLAAAGATMGQNPVIVDLNLDGYNDLVVVQDRAAGGAGAPVTVAGFLQPSGGGLIPTTPSCSVNLPTPVATTTDSMGALAAGDFDGDGQPEIAVVTYYWSNSGGFLVTNSGRLRILEFQAPCGLSIASEASLSIMGQCGAFSPICSIHAPVVGDVTGDNIPDILVVHQDWTVQDFWLASFRYTGGALTLQWDHMGFPVATYFSVSAPALVEMDSTHAGFEVVWGGDLGNAAAQLLLCRPTNTAANCNYSIATTTGVRGLASADMDGDGFPEVVANGRSSTGSQKSVHIFRTTPGPGLTSAATHTDSYQWNIPAMGDVDGDGRADLVNVIYSEYAASVDTLRAGDLRVRGYNGGPTVQDKGIWTRSSPPTNLQSRGGPVLVDITNDARNAPRPEAVFGSGGWGDSAGDVNLVAGTTAPVAQLWTTALGGRPHSGVAVGDLSGDCRPDFAVGLHTGSAAVVRGVDGVRAGAPAWNMVSPFASPGAGLQAKLVWIAPSDGGLPITHYKVWRSPGTSGAPSSAWAGLTPGATWTQVAIWPAGWQAVPTSGLPYVDVTVPTAGHWWYRVQAVTCFGDGNPSVDFRSEVLYPPAPASLNGVVGNVATPVRQVQLSWSAVASNSARPNGCGGIDNYRVYRDTSPSFPAPVLLATLSPATLSYLDNSAALLTDGDYYYRVRAVNCVGEGPASPTFWAEVKIPFTPATFTATVNVGTPSVTLAWSASASNSPPASGCGEVLRYRVLRSVNLQNGPYVAYATVSAPATSYVDSAVVSGNHYYYRIAAENCVATGTQLPSALGRLADIKPPLTPLVTPSVASGTSVNLAWSAPGDPASDGAGVGVAYYQIHWKQGTVVDPAIDPSFPNQPVGTNSLVHAGLTPNLQYCYIVRAVDLNGNLGAWTTEACVTLTDTVPPSGLTLSAASSTSSRVDLSWTAATDNVAVTGYEYFWRAGPGVLTTDPLVGGLPAGPLSAAHNGLLGGTNYCFRMRAFDGAGNRGPLSNEACATTLMPPTYVPSGTVTVLEDAGLVTVSAWATSIQPGVPAPPGTGLRFVVSGITNPALFAAAPTVSPTSFSPAPWSGALSFEPAQDACGASQFTLVLESTTGDASAPQVFTVAVTCVNDPPGFTLASEAADAGPNGAAVVMSGFATLLQTGPPTAVDEAGQRLRFEVSTTNPVFFSVPPSISPATFQNGPWSGTLTFTPAPGLYGVVPVTVCLRDDGGTANGGNDLFCRSLTIRVLAPPTAVPDCYTTAGILAVPAPGVAGNDVSVTGLPPQAMLASGPTNAQSFALQADGSFTYVPRQGFRGLDGFSYRAVDGPYISDVTTVCIEVLAPGSNLPPVAAFMQGPAKGVEASFLDASYDPDGDVVAWSWDFGDGRQASGRQVLHTFTAPGSYSVVLTVTDDSGLSDSAQKRITVGDGRQTEAQVAPPGEPLPPQPTPPQPPPTPPTQPPQPTQPPPPTAPASPEAPPPGEMTSSTAPPATEGAQGASASRLAENEPSRWFEVPATVWFGLAGVLAAMAAGAVIMMAVARRRPGGENALRKSAEPTAIEDTQQ